MVILKQLINYWTHLKMDSKHGEKEYLGPNQNLLDTISQKEGSKNTVPTGMYVGTDICRLIVSVTCFPGILQRFNCAVNCPLFFSP